LLPGGPILFKANIFLKEEINNFIISIIMKLIKSISAVFIAAAFVVSCKGRSEPKTNDPAPVDNTRNADTPGSKTNASIYFCPMHPEITSDKPGVCPKCKMDLELKEDTIK
jgi:hypothetical protein